MRILAAERAIPSQLITNDWIVAAVREASASVLSARELDVVEMQVRTFLDAAGTHERYCLAEDENAIDFALSAAKRAVETAQVSADDIEFVLYAGVARGWLEPATAPVLQGALGYKNAACFDVLDACASWLRALQIAHTLLRAGVYRCGLIVNCEAGFQCYRDFALRSLADLEHCFASYTIGEAATATVVRESAADDFRFVFRSFGEHARLCMIPLEGASGFLPGDVDPELSKRKFYSLSRELLSVTAKRIVEVFESEPGLADPPFDICFGHAASEKASQVIARKLRLPYERHFSTHAAYGNTVAASIPLGMSLAIEQGALRRGDRVLVIVGASGITVGVARFTY